MVRKHAVYFSGLRRFCRFFLKIFKFVDFVNYFDSFSFITCDTFINLYRLFDLF